MKLLIFFLFLLSHLSALASLGVKTFRYGEHERQVFDLWSPMQPQNAPLLVFIHGGGFSSGDKSDLVKNHDSFLKHFIKNGYVVASINYRFLRDVPLHQILKEDIAGFVQFIRFNARKFGINPRYIVTMGASAGGSAGLWLGTHPDIADPQHPDPVKRQSSRILAFAHINAQAGYNFLDWFDYFGEDTTRYYLKSQIWTRFHLQSFEHLFSPEGQKMLTTVDSVRNMSEDDAAMYIYNSYRSISPDDEAGSYDDFLHGPHHAHVLIKRAREVGLVYKANILSDRYPEQKSMLIDIYDFFQTQIKQTQKR